METEHPDAAGAPEPRLGLRYAALSDVGRVRKDNQDSGFASPHLLVVADGVGGAARGDVASTTAVQALRRLDAPPHSDLLEALAGAIHRAHDRIAELVEQDPALDGTSTTVSAALFDGSRIGVAHIGDSRGYLLRDGVLSQLTKDHTFVQSLIDEGRITESESRTHPHRNLILRAVDGVHETDPDLFHIELAAGDRLLLCSDGASGVLDASRLTDILSTGSPDYAVVELVRASLEAGSTDNVTCVVADVVPDDEAPDPESSGASGEAVIVGAAGDQLGRGGTSPASGSFRGHRSGDTGEIDPVPAGGGDSSADAEQLRYAPQPPRRGRGPRGLLVALVVVALLAVVGYGGYRWSQSQYFVAEHAGKVAIYRGVQADIPGVRLNHLAEDTEVTIASLPDYPTQQVASGISADSLTAARAVVTRLNGLARICPAPVPTPTVSATPTPSTAGSPAATPRPSPSAAPSPSVSPTPTATPTASASPTLAPPDCLEVAP
jgi:serine/threonine protein phosphatase PrpC